MADFIQKPVAIPSQFVYQSICEMKIIASLAIKSRRILQRIPPRPEVESSRWRPIEQITNSIGRNFPRKKNARFISGFFTSFLRPFLGNALDFNAANRHSQQQ